MIPEISIDNGCLLTVPAVHYRSVFAQLVNEVCAETGTRPKAVAVELGSRAVAAVSTWLRELGADSKGQRRELPCMLGLVTSNRCIHPVFKARAIRLQEIHGLPLHRIPASVLREELGYSSLSLICLSATDSIIEAIRSAIEWDIPVYGVDLEEFAESDRSSVMIEDPLAARGNLGAYIDRNAAHGMACRDEWVDSRREQFMAARLRHLVQRHGRVLFTGGLAHWSELARLLRDPGLVARDALPPRDGCAYERVLVDPAIAIHQMDMYPDFTLHFESLRKRPVHSMERMFTPLDGVLGKLKDAYQSVAGGKIAESNSRERIADYFSYLGSLCLVNQRIVPDLFLALSAASSIVSREFAEQMGRILIMEAMTWAKPEDYPNLRYLRAMPSDPGERHMSNRWHKAELVGTDGQNGPHFVVGPGQDFPVGPEMPPLPIRLESSVPPPSEAKSNSADSKRGPYPWIWPPCENLFYGTAYKAAELAFTQASQGTIEPFAGALHEGIDSKATVRAAARGDDRLYVRIRTARRTSSPREALSEPFVYIFDRLEAARYTKTEWSLAQGGSSLGAHIRDRYRERFKTVTARDGEMFVASVHIAEERQPESRLAGCRYVSGLKLLWGSVAFGNPCLNSVQSARWLEEGDFRCCPVMHQGGIGSLVRMYKDRHGIHLDLENWPETLIRIAVQYARQRVVVIAPDHSVVSARAHMEARGRRISLDFHPLSYFAAERIAAIRRQYLVYPKDVDATQWPEEVIRLLGEESDAHVDLLPPFIRAQTQENG